MDRDYLPQAIGGCPCDCHRMPGVYHVMACCGTGRTYLDVPWKLPENPIEKEEEEIEQSDKDK